MAYTRVNWSNLPSTDTPINATNLNVMDKGIKDLEDDVNLCVKVRDFGGNVNIDAFKDWLINTAPSGEYLVHLNMSGAVSCAIVQKANSNYICFIHFSYSTTAKQYKYVTGTWTETQL